MKEDFVSQGILAAKCGVRIVFITECCMNWENKKNNITGNNKHNPDL